MTRFTITALASVGCWLALAATSPPPPDSSHIPKQPLVATPKPASKPPITAAIARPVATAKPVMSEWRRAYIARTGHAPPAAGDAHAAPAKKAVPPIRLKKRCS